MIPQFENLSPSEVTLLLKAPALVSVLAASGDKEVSDKAKAEAIKQSHLETFTAKPVLRDYYDAVEKTFESNFDAVKQQYAPFDEPQITALKGEIDKVNAIIATLDRDYALALHESLTHYAEHVKKSERSILENFIFPFPLPGITD